MKEKIKILQLFKSEEDYMKLLSKKEALIEEFTKGVWFSDKNIKEYSIMFNLKTGILTYKSKKENKQYNIIDLNNRQFKALQDWISQEMGYDKSVSIYNLTIELLPKDLTVLISDLNDFGYLLSLNENKDKYILSKMNKGDVQERIPEEWSINVLILMNNRELYKIENYLYRKGWLSELLFVSGNWVEQYIFQMSKDKSSFIYEKSGVNGMSLKSKYNSQYLLWKNKKEFLKQKENL